MSTYSSQILYKTMIDYIYKNQAIEQMFSTTIWDKFKNENSTLCTQYSALNLKILFHNVVLKDINLICSFDDNLILKYFQGSHCAQLIEKIKINERFQVQPMKLVNHANDLNIKNKEIVLYEKTKRKYFEHIFSYMVSTDDERGKGIFHPRIEIFKRMREIIANSTCESCFTNQSISELEYIRKVQTRIHNPVRVPQIPKFKTKELSKNNEKQTQVIDHNFHKYTFNQNIKTNGISLPLAVGLEI